MLDKAIKEAINKIELDNLERDIKTKCDTSKKTRYVGTRMREDVYGILAYRARKCGLTYSAYTNGILERFCEKVLGRKI